MKNLHDFSESVAGLRYPMGGARSSFPHATNSHALYTYRESMVVVGHCGIVDNFVYFDPAVDKFGGFREDNFELKVQLLSTDRVFN
jgi:hypothetical protein